MRQWDRLYYVGADAKQSGVLQGELAVEMIRQNSQIDHNKDGKIQYVFWKGKRDIRMRSFVQKMR